MIKTLTAYTLEVDNVPKAVSGILEQLDLERNLMKNSVGILHCSTYFIESGVVEALCKALPFRIVGVTTVGSVVHDEVNEIIMALMVLTSDDVHFAVGLTEPITSPDESALKKAYEEAATHLPGLPALAISYFPVVTATVGAGGDFVIRTMSAVSGGVPVFGTMPIDNTHDFREARIICDGMAYADRFAFILLQGNIKPRFYLGAVSEENILQDRGTVTKSEGTFLHSINDVPILDYLKKTLKLPLDEKDPSSVHMIPLILDFNDGTPPIVRAMNSFTDDHIAVCSAELPIGATLGVSRFSRDVVLETTNRLMQTILENESDADGLLIYSCAARYWALGLDSLVEMEAVRDSLIHSKIPYLLGYSCGELCPVPGMEGKLTNRLHNYTFIACVF